MLFLKNFIVFSVSYIDPNWECDVCNKTFIDEEKLWPTPGTFKDWLPTFLIDNPCELCPKGGHAAYGLV